MDEHHDIYQKPPAPPPGPGPLPSYDLRPDQARLKARKQTITLVTVMAALLVLAAVHFFVQESHWTKTEQLREALSRPLFAHVQRTNTLTGSLAPQVAPLPDDFDQNMEAPPADVSPARMAEAMGHLRIGNEYLRARDLERAEEEVRGALAIWPNMNAGLRMLGMIHIQRGQFDQAIVALERAQRSDPFSAETYNNLATAYMQKRMLDRAEELLLTSLQIRPGFSVAELNLGLLYILWGRYDEAIGHLEEALVQLPDHPSLLNNLAVCHIRLGRYEEARIPLLRLVERSTANAAPYFNLAITYALQEQYGEAMARIRQGAEHCSPAECQTYLKDSDFDRLRGFPEYQQFVRGLYPELPSLPPGPET
jgi:tetratricopeptide (TPR) repeat protein